MPSIPILPNQFEGAPSIDRSLATSEEAEALVHLQTLLGEVGLHERRFRLAVYLYNYCDAATHEMPDFQSLELALWTTGGWKAMAARDGALSVYHFGRTLEAIKSTLGRVRAIANGADNKAISTVISIFYGAFPAWIELRHAVAHVGDSAVPEKRAENSARGSFRVPGFYSDDENATTWLPGNMYNNIYSASNNGKALSYELSEKTANKLTDYTRRVYSAFAAVTSQPSA